MTLRDAALAAAEQARTEAEAAREQSKRDLRDAATAALVPVITGADDKPVVAPSSLQVKHVDLDSRLVVVSDGSVALAVQGADDGVWKVLLVDEVDGKWARRSGPVGSLAELGEALT